MQLRTRIVTVASGAVLALSLGVPAAFAATTPPTAPTPVQPTAPVTPGGPTINPNIGIVPTPCPTATIRTFAPTAGPTISPKIGTVPTNCPTPPPVVNPLPETFAAQITQVGNTVTRNFARFTGPVAGTGTDDLATATNTRDRFLLPTVFRAINVDHSGIGTPAVNLRLCVASLTQLGAWRFNRIGSTGPFTNASGNGSYLLTGQWVFPTVRNVCSLALIRGNPLLQRAFQPTYQSVQVWGTGTART